MWRVFIQINKNKICISSGNLDDFQIYSSMSYNINISVDF